jgi:CRP-like cAMP-binding protein
VLGTTLVRLEENTPVVSRFASVRRRLRRAAERGQLLALNPFELVYVFDPVESMERYGEDSFTVPRARMTGVRIQDEELEVSSNGVRFLLSMAPPLREAAIRWCG